MEYNSQRGLLLMKEYGRYIQRMVKQVLDMDDAEKRLQQCRIIIENMAMLNPSIKTTEDYKHTLWDHLHAMAGFKLNIEGPYPMPEPETYQARPEILPYPKRHPKYSHLGKNLELVIEKALAEEEDEKRTGFANAIAYYMKLSYSNWHKELVPDDVIRTELDDMTGGALNFSNTPYIRHKQQHQGFEDEYPAAGRNGRRHFARPQRNPVQPGNRMPTGNNRNNNNRNNNNRNSGFKKRY